MQDEIESRFALGCRIGKRGISEWQCESVRIYGRLCRCLYEEEAGDNMADETVFDGNGGSFNDLDVGEGSGCEAGWKGTGD